MLTVYRSAVLYAAPGDFTPVTASILVRGTKIIAVAPDEEMTADTDEVCDLTGYAVIPGGFCDLRGAFPAEDSFLNRLRARRKLKELLYAGFTTAAADSTPLTRRLRDEIDSFRIPGPRVLFPEREVPRFDAVEESALPALLGVGTVTGTVAPGKSADFVVTDEENRTVMTVFRGHRYPET